MSPGSTIGGVAMPFEVVSNVINNLTGRRIPSAVIIRRRLFEHSSACLEIAADEGQLEGPKANKAVSLTAANALGSPVTVRWRGKDMRKAIECFRGYVSGVSSRHRGGRSFLALHCLSASARTDLIPRFRVWQGCTLLDICSHIQKSEPIIEIAPNAQSVLSKISIDLSVQYDETDFQYLRRMLFAWGIPLAVDDRAGRLVIGTPKISGSGEFPDIHWHWDSVGLEGSFCYLDGKGRSTGTSAPEKARASAMRLDQELSRVAAGYEPRLDDEHLQDREWIAEREAESACLTDLAVWRLRWSGAVMDWSPGTAVKFGGADCLIREVHIESTADSESVTQEFVAQTSLIPLQPHLRRVQWPSRVLWAKVTKNNHEDPKQQGRVQVEFDCETLDPTGNEGRRCWLPVATPYGGLKGQGTSGFLSLPEVGERVLVQFLGEWDSDAVVIGAVRDAPREGYIYDPDETKRWRTPSGNQISFTTRGDTDVVRIKCQDKLILEGRISSGKQTVVLDLCDSSDNRIHFQGGVGIPRLDVMCSGEIYVSAGQKLLLEGGMVQIKSKMGPVNIDGAPMVMINCGPWSLQPLKLEPDNTKEKSPAKPKKKAKPPAWTAGATVAANPAASAAASSQMEESSFITITLKDKNGNPVPNERYRLKLPDGSIREGTLDAAGRAEVPRTMPGQAQVSFPDIAADEWRPVG